MNVNRTPSLRWVKEGIWVEKALEIQNSKYCQDLRGEFLFTSPTLRKKDEY